MSYAFDTKTLDRRTAYQENFLDAVAILVDVARLDAAYPAEQLPVGRVAGYPVASKTEANRAMYAVTGVQPPFLQKHLATIGFEYGDLVAAALYLDADYDVTESVAVSSVLWQTKPLGRFLKKFGSDPNMLALAFHNSLVEGYDLPDDRYRWAMAPDVNAGEVATLVKVASEITSFGRLDHPEIKFLLQTAEPLSATQLEVFFTLVDDATDELWDAEYSYMRRELFRKLLGISQKVVHENI